MSAHNLPWFVVRNPDTGIATEYEMITLAREARATAKRAQGRLTGWHVEFTERVGNVRLIVAYESGRGMPQTVSVAL